MSSLGDLSEQLHDTMDVLRNNREPFLDLRGFFKWRVIQVGRGRGSEQFYTLRAGPFWSKKRARVMLALQKSLLNLKGRDELEF